MQGKAKNARKETNEKDESATPDGPSVVPVNCKGKDLILWVISYLMPDKANEDDVFVFQQARSSIPAFGRMWIPGPVQQKELGFALGRAY